jgi:cytochrome b6-f complex iron-sulfur subunit/menaquinol-cytochrome c reductase iron-sulfur subunit
MAEPTQKEADAVGQGHAAQHEAGPPGPEEPRRGALRTIVAFGSLAYVGALAVPAAEFVGGPAAAAAGGGGKARWVRVGRLDDLPQGEPRRLQVIGDERDAFTLVRDQLLGSVWVLREGDKVRAMSATCPHLGCAIDLGADKKSFACPCHASRFALTGATEAGPSPRGMDALEARVQEGWVEIDFRRFRQGTTDREEAGT